MKSHHFFFEILKNLSDKYSIRTKNIRTCKLKGGIHLRIDVTQDSKTQSFQLEVRIDQFKNLKEYEVLLNLISAISLDFDLDPEMTIDDLKKIVSEAKNEEAQEISIEIGKDGIDVGF